MELDPIELKERRGIPVVVTNGTSAPLAANLFSPAATATGTITLGTVTDGETVTISDGSTSVVFEFDDNASVGEGNVAIDISPPEPQTAQRSARAGRAAADIIMPQMTPAEDGVIPAGLLLTAINDSALAITATATDPASATINLANDAAVAAGNVAIVKSGANITVTGMSGGKDAATLDTLQDAIETMSITLDMGNITIDTVDLESSVGEKADAAASTDTGSFSIISLLKRGLANWTTLLNRIPAIGRKDTVGSVSVTLSSDHATVPVTGTVSIGAITAGDTNIGNVDVVTMPAITGTVSISSIIAGDTNIGNVDIVSMPAITGTVSISEIAAGDANIGNVDVVTMPAITGTVAVSSVSQKTDYLVASGTRDATTGDGTAVIAADATKYVEYHQIKIQRVASTGDQTVVWKNGSTVIDNCLVQLDSVVPGLVLDYNGKVCGSVNTAQYFNTSSAITFKYWILYRLVTP